MTEEDKYQYLCDEYMYGKGKFLSVDEVLTVLNSVDPMESRVKELEGRLLETQGWLREILKMGLTGDMEGLGSIQDRLLNGERND